jgi:hypothetical protein
VKGQVCSVAAYLGFMLMMYDHVSIISAMCFVTHFSIGKYSIRSADLLPTHTCPLHHSTQQVKMTEALSQSDLSQIMQRVSPPASSASSQSLRHSHVSSRSNPHPPPKYASSELHSNTPNPTLLHRFHSLLRDRAILQAAGLFMSQSLRNMSGAAELLLLVMAQLMLLRIPHLPVKRKSLSGR